MIGSGTSCSPRQNGPSLNISTPSPCLEANTARKILETSRETSSTVDIEVSLDLGLGKTGIEVHPGGARLGSLDVDLESLREIERKPRKVFLHEEGEGWIAIERFGTRSIFHPDFSD